MVKFSEIFFLLLFLLFINFDVVYLFVVCARALYRSSNNYETKNQPILYLHVDLSMMFTLVAISFSIIICLFVLLRYVSLTFRFQPFNQDLSLTKKSVTYHHAMPYLDLIVYITLTIFLVIALMYFPNLMLNSDVLNSFSDLTISSFNCFLYLHKRYGVLLIYIIMLIPFYALYSMNLKKFINAVLLWYTSMILELSFDVHPNPGPLPHHHDNYTDGFFSFCNWNINTLSKDDFYRVTLLEAHKSIFKYDTTSLCETSLNDSMIIEENLLPGYKFISANNPDGSKNGGVGIFYKENLPLLLRHDLSFSECLVTELNINNKKIFFTVLYRNPIHKARTPQFSSFLVNFENLYSQIQTENSFIFTFTFLLVTVTLITSLGFLRGMQMPKAYTT